jgi:chromosome segregation ATPase
MLDEALEAQSQELQSVKAENLKLKGRISDMTEEKGRLEDTIKSILLTRDASDRIAMEAEARVASLKERVDSSEQELARFRLDQAASSVELTSLKGEVESAQDDKRSLIATILSLENSKASLLTQVGNLKQSIRMEKASSSDAQRLKIEELSRALEVQEKRSEEYKIKCELLVNEISSFKDLLASMRIELSKQLQRNENLLTENKTLRRENYDLHAQMDDIHEALIGSQGNASNEGEIRDDVVSSGIMKSDDLLTSPSLSTSRMHESLSPGIIEVSR